MDSLNLNDLLELQKRFGNQVSMSIEIITPDLARNYLMTNLRNKTIKNRRIHARTVSDYVGDILNDRWKLGAPFLFDILGNLIDGQTRCTAVVKANKPIIAIVIRGLDPDSFDTIDCGKKRTHKNVLETLIFNGKELKKPACVSSGINIMLSFEKNYKQIDKTRAGLTNPEIFNMVKADFDYFNNPFETEVINKWKKNINMAIGESIFAAFYYANKKTHDDLDNFLDVITSNEMHTPAVVREFRDIIMENKGRRSDERGYLSARQIYMLIDTLFKYHCEKEGMSYRKHISKKDLEIIHE